MRHIRISTSSEPQMRSMRAPPRSRARTTASAGNRDGRRLSASMATMSGVLLPAPAAVRAFGAAPPARSASTRSSAKVPRALAAACRGDPYPLAFSGFGSAPRARSRRASFTWRSR